MRGSIPPTGTAELACSTGMAVMDEREWFAQPFPNTDPGRLWDALQRALATMDLKSTDDNARVALFGTGVTWTSWGQHLRAEVSALESGGALLAVRGRPRSSFLSTGWGERIHAHAVQRQLVADIEAKIPGQA